MDLASLGVSFGASKFPYNEEIHFRSSIFESHDDTAEGILILSLLCFVVLLVIFCLHDQ